MTTTAIITQETSIVDSQLEVIIPQKELVNALSKIAVAISKRPVTPILANVKIEASESDVILSATNLEVYAKVSCPSQVLACGEITVNHKDLLALVKPLKKGLVRLHAQDSKLFIDCGPMHTELPTIDVDGYPCEPQPQTDFVEEKVTLPVATFRQMVNAVAPSAKAEYDPQTVFTGISTKLHNDKLTFACADSHRLHIMNEQIEGAGTWNADWILPAKILFDLLKKFPKNGDLSLFIKSPSFATLTCGNITAHIRMIEGTYPNYEAIIPKKESLNISFSASASTLLNALDIIAPIAKENSNITRLHLNGSLVVKSRRDTIDNFTEVQVEAKVTGEEAEMIYSHVFLQSVLKISPTSDIQFSCEGAKKACVMKLSELPGFMAVIMPMSPNA